MTNNKTDIGSAQHADRAYLQQLLQKRKDGDVKAGDELHALLLAQAAAAAKFSYSPYSQFPVGAAVLTSSGELILGCNVENASFGVTICAERTALVKGISAGIKDFEIIAVVCTKVKDAWPCGICRQFISEFGSGIEIVSEGENGEVKVMKISELLPKMFGPGALGL